MQFIHTKISKPKHKTTMHKVLPELSTDCITSALVWHQNIISVTVNCNLNVFRVENNILYSHCVKVKGGHFAQWSEILAGYKIDKQRPFETVNFLASLTQWLLRMSTAVYQNGCLACIPYIAESTDNPAYWRSCKMQKFSVLHDNTGYIIM